MGTFLGHFIPSLYGILLGFWWMYNIAVRYYTMAPFRSSTWFLWRRYPTVPIEPWSIVVMSAVSIAYEFTDVFEEHGFSWLNAQHTLMYITFLCVSITQLLQWYHHWVPPGLDYVFWMLQYFLTGYLLYYHLHARSPVDVMFHTQLIICNTFLFFSTFLEALYRDWVIPATCRAMFALLLGMNLMHTGFILYPPWICGLDQTIVNQTIDLKSHSAMIKANILFVFEVCLCSILTLISFGLVYAFHRNEVIRLNGTVHPQEWMKRKGIVENQSENCNKHQNYNCSTPSICKFEDDYKILECNFARNCQYRK